jgi:hypothetical protein
MRVAVVVVATIGILREVHRYIEKRSKPSHGGKNSK